MIRELIQVYKILRWHKRTFPKHTYLDQRKHHIDEMHEWMQAMRDLSKAKHPTKRANLKEHLKEEQADVIISGINLLRFDTAFKSVQKKMNKNYTRTWNNDHHKENENETTI